MFPFFHVFIFFHDFGFFNSILLGVPVSQRRHAETNCVLTRV